MNYVINQSSWIVKGKPIVVQKWDPSVNIEKVNPCKIHIWSRLVNVPLEAWSPIGISTLASMLRKPIMMDFMTTSTCHRGIRRAGYAIVLVEITCGVFGHKENGCKSRSTKAVKERNVMEKVDMINNGKNDNEDGFVAVRNRKNYGYGNNAQQRYKSNAVNGNQRFQYRLKEKKKNETYNVNNLKDKGKKKEMNADMARNNKCESPPSLEKI
ncbi:RNA-directed DNA polymerase, eukaryota, reverse transcriptase zinc-binding domain protein [Tanacetum coccineum]